MALALWAAAEPTAVAWVALDRYDNHPESFWPHVIAALRRCGVVIPEALPGGLQEQGADHVFLLRLVSALATQDPPVILVLDDFHLLTEPEVLKGLDFVLRNVGSGLRMVVSSRADPPLRLHRYRLAGELTEIRADDLAFNHEEASLLLAQYRGTISADSLDRLMRRTEGWAAGLRLAAISMDTHPDPDQFVKELITEDSALTGYLVEEVLHTQPPEVQDVLLSTSILEQVSAEAASELAGDEQAAANPARTGPREHVHPAHRIRVVPLSPVVRGGTAPQAEAQVPGTDARSAPPGGPLLRAERLAHRRRAARRPSRRLAARRQHGRRRPGNHRDHPAAGQPGPVPGPGVREHAGQPGLERARAVPGLRGGRPGRW